MRAISLEAMASSFDAGEVVFIAGASGEAVGLTSVLADADAHVADAKFITTFLPGINTRCVARPGRASRVAAFFMQPSLHEASREGRVDFLPISFLGAQRYLTDQATRIDTAIIQVSLPDRQGRCSLGPAVEFFPSIMSHVTRLFGVVNNLVPRLPGSVSVPLESFECIAYSSAPIATYDVGEPSPASELIVRHLAALIPSGATLQVGLGKIPAHLLLALRKHRRLSLHSGMISDSALQLAAAGALRENRQIRVALALGSPELYRNLAGLRDLSFAEVAYTHAPEILAKVGHFYAINSAIEVDLLGQVNSEMLNGHYISGPGGLPDFARAAHLDPNGLSIIALNATDRSATRSRIVAHFRPGTPVSVAQHDIDAVVTEFGVAMLRGQPVDERARRLIAVAAPSHRASLERAVKDILA
jgi:acyl-CoA hydrolase